MLYFLEHSDAGLKKQHNAPNVAIILALALCYYSRLDRQQRADYVRQGDLGPFQRVLEYEQNALLDAMQLDPTVAKNEALRANAFMMVTCIHNRLPLFVVGSPGSSKSLAMQIIQDSFRGKESQHTRLQAEKTIRVTSFQCSPLSTPEAIQQTFERAKRNRGERQTPVVLLDEVGLADSSPHLPLKVLHRLLEEPIEEQIAVVGLSNWALDAAKMNRALFLYRSNPTREDLQLTAVKIMGATPARDLQECLPALVRAYLSVHAAQQQGGALQQFSGFYGLRDFYTMIKQLQACAQIHHLHVTTHLLQWVTRRNFSGLSDLRALELFATELRIGGLALTRL